MKRLVSTAAALVIGNEILNGKVAEANVVVLARTLRGLGISLRRVVTVPDEQALIAAELRTLSAAHDVVFTSGGVGPTHDDVTVAAVAEAFGAAVEVKPALEEMLRGYYGERITDGHLLMARVPVGSELVTTAAMPWPTIVMRNVWVLPGVPQIFVLKMAVLETQLEGTHAYVARRLYTKLDEGALKAWLDVVVAAHPDVEIGSYPKWHEPRFRTLITFDGAEAAPVEAARQALRALLPADAIVAEESHNDEPA